MSQDDNFRDDEKVLESIRRTQELMREPEGLDFEKIFLDSWDNYWVERELAYGFIRVILDITHQQDGWWTRLKMERSFKTLEDKIRHIKTCTGCGQTIGHAVKAIEFMMVPPRIVTREDAEIALRYLANKNHMSVEEFKSWIERTSEEVIRDMNNKAD